MVKLKIRYKIALILNALSILIIMLLSYLFYYQFSIVLKERILLQLSSIRNLKSKQIENVLADEIGTMTTMMRHLDDLPYLDAIAEDRLIDIDSIIVSYEGMGDRLSLEDISHQYDDGLIHLICHIPV
ncbi:MAG: hypothetical protein HRT61_22750, partial [Ekhidna sp.]|nr:hypothetical protein [Ekhidna sp.]